MECISLGCYAIVEHIHREGIARASFFREPATDVRVFILSLQRMPKIGYNTTPAFRLTTHSYNIDDTHT
jgi:hypothetical protein